MTAILESYRLTCNACGKPKKVSRLQVDGNLAEIERTWVCPECARAGAEPNRAQPESTAPGASGGAGAGADSPGETGGAPESPAPNAG